MILVNSLPSEADIRRAVYRQKAGLMQLSLEQLLAPFLDACCISLGVLWQLMLIGAD